MSPTPTGIISGYLKGFGWSDHYAHSQADAICERLKSHNFKIVELEPAPVPVPPASTEMLILLEAAVTAFNRLTPEQKEEMIRKQRESWVRGEMALGR